jgi:hypothetical protein
VPPFVHLPDIAPESLGHARAHARDPFGGDGTDVSDVRPDIDPRAVMKRWNLMPEGDAAAQNKATDATQALVWEEVPYIPPLPIPPAGGDARQRHWRAGQPVSDLMAREEGGASALLRSLSSPAGGQLGEGDCAKKQGGGGSPPPSQKI